MEVSIIKIGNSKGLRLSKQIIEQYQITDKVELTLEQDKIIIRPIDEPRKGWDMAFKMMSEKGDDNSLIDDVFDDEDLDEWN
jgi:antitoxin MazE